MLYLVWPHINFLRERKVIVNLAALQSTQVKVESLQVEDQVIGNGLETCSEKSLVLSSETEGVDLPLNRINMAIASGALVFII